jgi:hypothetical protein
MRFKQEEIRKLQKQNEEQEDQISQLVAERRVLLDLIKKLGQLSMENCKFIKKQFQDETP